MLREQENQGSTHAQSWPRLQDCCNEKSEALKEELEGDSRKWKDASCSWIDISKIDISLDLVYCLFHFSRNFLKV